MDLKNVQSIDCKIVKLFFGGGGVPLAAAPAPTGSFATPSAGTPRNAPVRKSCQGHLHRLFLIPYDPIIYGNFKRCL